MDDMKRNGENYYDPTPYQAYKNLSADRERVTKLIKTIQSVAHLAGFEIVGRITLRDKTTGRKYD